MTHHLERDRQIANEIPRRLKLSAREISVALALTCAAAIQFAAASGESEKLARPEASSRAALIQTAR